jgi:hypothetical protein
MRNDEWISMLQLIPHEQRNQIVIVMQNGMELVVDTIFRFEPNYLVARGRATASTDEGRAYFVPYDQMLFYRLDRVVKLHELSSLYGEVAGEEAVAEEPPTEEVTTNGEALVAEPLPAAPTMLAGTGTPLNPDAANTVARNNLLARIRAARATSAPGN